MLHPKHLANWLQNFDFAAKSIRLIAQCHNFTRENAFVCDFCEGAKLGAALRPSQGATDGGAHAVDAFHFRKLARQLFVFLG